MHLQWYLCLNSEPANDFENTCHHVSFLIVVICEESCSQAQYRCDLFLQYGIHCGLRILGQSVRKLLQLCKDLLDPIVSIADILT